MSKKKDRIRESNYQYKHGLGQNFIYDDDLLEALAMASGIEQTDDVLEIGPGTGTLTKHLAKYAHRVISLELDERLIPLTQAYLSAYPHVQIMQGDAMRVDFQALTQEMQKPLSVVANIPYYITTPLLLRLMDSGMPIKRMALMVQKEVAEKMLSQPGTEGWGMLAARCQMAYEGEIAMEVPARCFTPVPKVDSAFVVLQARSQPAVAVQCEEDFWKILQAGFALRRKTLTNGLMAGLRMERTQALALMEKAGLSSLARGEQLSLQEVAVLSDVYTQWRKETEDDGSKSSGEISQ